MKKCSNCGALLRNDDLFCPNCHEEVQLVPNFETVESSIREQQRILEEKEKERLAILAMEEAEREKTTKKRNRIVMFTSIAVIAVAAFFVLSFLIRTSGKSAFNSRYTKAVEAYNSGSYDESLNLITVALEKDPGNMEGKILMADIYAAQGKTDMATALYLEIIEENPDSESAYRKLINMYEILGQGANIHSLLSRCSEQAILDKFNDYITPTPKFSLDAGTYESAQDLEITDEKGNPIYYTLDGTEPSNMSLAYNNPIGLTGGKITVKAVSVNDHGVPSDTVESVFEINAAFVDAPIVFPRSNTFTFDDGRKHAFTVIVPRGFKAYYSFDSMPTQQSQAYTGPVDMLEGSHVFYAILVDKKTGMESTPTSLSYTLGASEVQESISIVQDANGNVNATYSDGTEYVPPAPAPAPAPVPVPDNGGGNYTPDPGPAPGPGDGGGNTNPDPGPAPGPGDGGGTVVPDPGPGDGGGEVVPDPGPGDGGGEVVPEPVPEEPAPETVAETVE